MYFIHSIALLPGDLHNKSFLSAIGEQMGSGLGMRYGIRNADDNVTMRDVTDEIHDLSRVFTGAVYDIIVNMFEITRKVILPETQHTIHKLSLSCINSISLFCMLLVTHFNQQEKCYKVRCLIINQSRSRCPHLYEYRDFFGLERCPI